MQINGKALDEFISKYREEFGDEISRSEASEMAFRLVTLYEVLAKRLPSATPIDAEPPRQPTDLQV
jgi:hypothetical protein